VRMVEVKQLLDALVRERDTSTWDLAVPIADELVAWLASSETGVVPDDGPSGGEPSQPD
jgi:hypothetical protein